MDGVDDDDPGYVADCHRLVAPVAVLCQHMCSAGVIFELAMR
jgi:hypothetical protein